jgi:hypothetical protein
MVPLELVVQRVLNQIVLIAIQMLIVVMCVWQGMENIRQLVAKMATVKVLV